MERVKAKVVEFCAKAKKIARDDHRRVTHSLKVGLALTLVSSLYYYQPVFDKFGDSAIWAVMTVVVIFEFTVGATLGKGLNRGLATLFGAALGVGVHHLASLSGEILEPLVLGFFVFLQAAATTYLRFIPEIKARYDYACLIFILTFSLVTVSGYRDDKIIELALDRLCTIMMGGAVCVVVSICICPVWAGEDLHNLIANNMAKLGNSLQGLSEECLVSSNNIVANKKKVLEAYKTLLNTKSTEESLSILAKWEPRHSRFHFRHPWEQYLAIGSLIRQCSYRVDALMACLPANIQVPEACRTMTFEAGKTLNELSLSMKRMIKPSSAQIHLERSLSASRNLNAYIKYEFPTLHDVAPLETITFLSIDIVNLTEKISGSVYELASSMGFEKTIELTVSPDPKKEMTMGDGKQESFEVAINVDDHHIQPTTQSVAEPEKDVVKEISIAIVTESSCDNDVNVIHESKKNIEVPPLSTNDRTV